MAGRRSTLGTNRPPLRPSSADIDLLPKGGDCLVLGVTPELVPLHWDSVVAVDHTLGMVHAVCPDPVGRAVLGSWLKLPLKTESRDVVLCDGGLHLQSYPDGQHQMLTEASRVLRPGGSLALRLFLPPPSPETPDQVLSELMLGGIPSLNHLKLRLGPAMQTNAETGVLVTDMYDRVLSLAPSLPDLAKRLGWEEAHLLAIENYRGSLNRYHFVSLDQVVAMLPPTLKLARLEVPDYAMGELCPTAVFQMV